MKCLVVGQGIAGTVLAHTLLRRGVSVRIADAGYPHQSSGAAAGIINPVTGKRFVKSWGFDTFFPFAQAFYRDMQAELHCTVWHEQPILRLLDTPQAANDWAARMAVPGYDRLLGERPGAGAWSAFLKPALMLGEIRQAARVDLPLLLGLFRQKMAAEDYWLEQALGPGDVLQWAGDVDYIFFCEGRRGRDNPFFPGLPWQLSKGEGLIFRFPRAPEIQVEEMVKSNLMIAPLPNGLFWAGATYDWAFDDQGPTTGAQQRIDEQLADMLSVPYEAVQRFGAIRPTVKDRRPFLGISRIHPKMVLFNGLGAKGALLAPYWAAQLADHLLDGAPLAEEVDIRRFEA